MHRLVQVLLLKPFDWLIMATIFPSSKNPTPCPPVATTMVLSLRRHSACTASTSPACESFNSSMESFRNLYRPYSENTHNSESPSFESPLGVPFKNHFSPTGSLYFIFSSH